MPKAILELPEMPKNCVECELKDILPRCPILSIRYEETAYTPNWGRRPDCPLKESKDEQH